MTPQPDENAPQLSFVEVKYEGGPWDGQCDFENPQLGPLEKYRAADSTHVYQLKEKVWEKKQIVRAIYTYTPNQE
jgi:hypothetical protein